MGRIRIVVAGLGSALVAGLLAAGMFAHGAAARPAGDCTHPRPGQCHIPPFGSPCPSGKACANGIVVVKR